MRVGATVSTLLELVLDGSRVVQPATFCDSEGRCPNILRLRWVIVQVLVMHGPSPTSSSVYVCVMRRRDGSFQPALENTHAFQISPETCVILLWLRQSISMMPLSWMTCKLSSGTNSFERPSYRKLLYTTSQPTSSS